MMIKILNPVTKIIISTGGTGGHVFTAISIAEKLKTDYPNSKILFVGSKDKVEMVMVPKIGYEIYGLDIQGYNRKNIFKNLLLPFKLVKSCILCFKIIKSFKPDIVVGFGGYASFSIVRCAQLCNIDTAIHEQNSIVGMANKILAKKAKLVLVAYSQMENYFQKNKIVFTGNPIRKEILEIDKIDKNVAEDYFNFKVDKNKCILIIGGSLGSRSINDVIHKNLEFFIQNDIRVIWQCGNNFDHYQTVKDLSNPNIKIFKFIDKIELAYKCADIIISRAGALSVSELALAGKAVIFVPYPHATGDHQTYNAKNYIYHNAAALIEDSKANTYLIPTLKNLLNNTSLINSYSTNIKKLAIKNADDLIVYNILKLVNKKRLVLDDIKSIFFVGIGGIGMSALARYCHLKNIKVSGYDKNSNYETASLSKFGINIYDDNANLSIIPKDIDCVVYTPAVPINTPIFQYLLKQNTTVIKRSQFLGKITNKQYNICVAGTHGKTSICTMLSYVLYNNPIGCNAFLGGISLNFHSNFIKSKHSEINVIEADEYDRSFMQLNPNIICLTAMDSDHLDIYGNQENMIKCYFEFLDKLDDKGILIVNYDLTLNHDFSKFNVISYSSTNIRADYYVKTIRNNKTNVTFSVNKKNVFLEEFKLNKVGILNVENSLPCIIISQLLDIDLKDIKNSLSNFSGVKRRFQIVAKHKEQYYIDDYAHHPVEIRKTIESARKLFKEKKITFIFQPHLFSRTKNFAKEFAEELEKVDELILMPIYPAREEPIAGITSEWLFSKVRLKNKILLDKSDVIKHIEKNINKIEIVMTVGAGDIDKIVENIKKIMERKSNKNEQGRN